MAEWERFVGRVRVLLSEVDEHGLKRTEPPPELRQLGNNMLYSGLFGLFFGGLVGARQYADKFMAANKDTVFASPQTAQRELNYASTLGFFRHGGKWCFKLAGFVGLFTATQLGLQVYRQKRDLLNVLPAGTLAGGLWGVTGGLQQGVRGLALGTGVGAVAGLLLQGLWLLEDLADPPEDRRRREEVALTQRLAARELTEQKLGATARLIQNMERQLHEAEGDT
eukprot:comp23179_c1_seq1/m.37556 comp23179_c1_seq1/g.37556  ORF comp23179_c1_seq1/g.37556 comp23179_c1_seq1/m.37556 type:complete len:224 (-) comp23179_c1_seq1:324-995(-)